MLLDQIAFLAAACDGMIASMVFLCLSQVMALVAIGCSVEMRSAYESSFELIGVKLVFHVGFYLAICTSLLCLLGIITSCGISRSSRRQLVFFNNRDTEPMVCPVHLPSRTLSDLHMVADRHRVDTAGVPHGSCLIVCLMVSQESEIVAFCSIP
jgi:hypothetical protein